MELLAAYPMGLVMDVGAGLERIGDELLRRRRLRLGGRGEDAVPDPWRLALEMKPALDELDRRGDGSCGAGRAERDDRALSGPCKFERVF
ncbi:MAG: hypothetical protein R3B99_02025 [Polyangiales bacterium]